MGTTINWQSQTWTLYPQRGVYWHEKDALLIADAHFGKAHAYRTLGVPVPHGTTNANLQRLNDLLQECSPRRLLVLGDFLHARHGRSDALLAAMSVWRECHRGLEIVLIRGNHDRLAGDPPAELVIRCVDEPWSLGTIELRHVPAVHDGKTPGRAVIAGHVHPKIILRDIDGTSVRSPCFVFGRNSALLPAFGQFTGGMRIRPGDDDRVFAIGDDAVIEVSAASAAQ